MAQERKPMLYCPADLAARTSRATALTVAAVVALLLAAVALATSWGPRSAVAVFAGVWALWMVLMPVAVITSAVRNPR